MQRRQSINQQAVNQIKAQLATFYHDFQQNIKSNSSNPTQLFIDNVIKNKNCKIPRNSLLHESLTCLRINLTDKKQINTIFLEENSINQILIQAQNLVDMAFVLQEHLNLKIMSKKVQYAGIIMESIDQKLSYFFQKEKGQIPIFLRFDSVLNFIQFKKQNPKEIFNKISQFQLKQLKEQIFILYKYLIQPWFQRKTPSKYYEQLSGIIFWNVIIDDDTPVKQQMLLNLNQKIGNYICSRKRSDGIFNYFKTFSYILDILSINYRKQDPFKVYGLAPLMNAFQNQIQSEQIGSWLNTKGKNLKPQQIQHIFRNSYNTGSLIFMFNLITKFNKTLKQRKQFNVLFHLYLSYIKKQYLDIILPNSSYLHNYFDILQFYVIGFINQQRLQGQSELDKLSKNLSALLIRMNFTYKKHYDRVIMFYKMYQARFSYLSTVSKKFLSDLQRLYHYNVQLMDVHNKIQNGVFREAGFEDQYNTGYQQLNIKRTDRYRGLMNLGNTCYMNSLMQAFFMTKKFRSAVLDIRDQQSLSQEKTVFYSLINLFTEMSTKNISADSQIVPTSFKLLTPEPFKSSYDQHDVGEFGRMYFESLTNQLQGDKNKDKIVKLFFNKINKSLVCTKCKTEKHNQQLVFDFILHLNKNESTIQISKLLAEYFKGQQLSDQNQVFCQRCNRKTNSLSVHHPIRLAESLIITIGLFEYSGGGKKIKKPFNFQFIINFSKILPNQNLNDENYELYAFIVHIGNEAERGHYICYARNLQQNPTIWYCFDDSYVTERQIQSVSDFQFGESQTPYLLFYTTTRKRKSLQHANSLRFSSQIKIN